MVEKISLAQLDVYQTNMKFTKPQKVILLLLVILFLTSTFVAISELIAYKRLTDDVSVAGAKTVYINPGDDVRQKFFDNKEANTTFILKSGVHSLYKPGRDLVYKSIMDPQADGVVITGEPGAVINGAVELTNPRRENNYWVYDNFTLETEPKPSSQQVEANKSGTGKVCQAEFPRCNYNEELYISTNEYPGYKMLKHVDNKSKLTADTWYYDYGANKVYLGADPSNKKVEMAVVQFALITSKRYITVKNLTFEKFATPAQRSTIEIFGDDGVIEYNEVRYVHGTGITVSKRGKMRYNYVHHNGQKGLGGKVEGGVVEFNEIAYNNQAGFEITWDAGGTKFALTKDITIRNNYSHHNKGPGIWTDIDVKNAVYDGNIVVFNEKHGIQHEISYDGEFKNNFVAYNGQSGSDFHQIFIQMSSNIKVHNNTVITPSTGGNGIIVQNDSGRDNSPTYGGPVTAHNVDVYNNKIYMLNPNGRAMGMRGVSSAYGKSFDEYAKTVCFYDNEYHVPSSFTTAAWDKQTFWEWGHYGYYKSYKDSSNQSVTLEERNRMKLDRSIVNSSKQVTALRERTNACNGKNHKLESKGNTILKTDATTSTVPQIPQWTIGTGPYGSGGGTGTSPTPTQAFCGDGIVQKPNNNGINEMCDDSNTRDGDGCSKTCQIETMPNPEEAFPPEVGSNYFVLQMEHYIPGGSNVGFFDKTTQNQGDATIRNDAVDIKSIGVNQYAVGYFATDEWLKFKVNVPKTTDYKLKIRSATSQPDAKIRVEVNGVKLTTIPIINTGNYTNFQEYEVTGGLISAGEKEIRIYAEKEFMDIDYIRFEEGTVNSTQPDKIICGKIDAGGQEGFLDINDFSAFVTNYGISNCGDGDDIRKFGCGSKDINNDGKIDIIDFGIFASRYGTEFNNKQGCRLDLLPKN